MYPSVMTCEEIQLPPEASFDIHKEQQDVKFGQYEELSFQVDPSIIPIIRCIDTKNFISI